MEQCNHLSAFHLYEKTGENLSDKWNSAVVSEFESTEQTVRLYEGAWPLVWWGMQMVQWDSGDISVKTRKGEYIWRYSFFS